ARRRAGPRPRGRASAARGRSAEAWREYSEPVEKGARARPPRPPTGGQAFGGTATQSTRSHSGSISEIAASRPRPTPAAPSKKPLDAIQSGPLWKPPNQERKPAIPSPGWRRSRAFAYQLAAAALNRSSPVAW